MKVKYTGNGWTLNKNSVYEVVDTCRRTDRYKIRNDEGRLEWYVKSNFIEVKEKVAVAETISTHLVSRIERELKETEERMAVLRKELEKAKNPPTNNLLERATRKLGTYWQDDVEQALNTLCEALSDTDEFNSGISMGIAREGDGIVLDPDYTWQIINRHGHSILIILDK